MPAFVLFMSPPLPPWLLQCAEAEKKTAGGVLLASDSGDKPNFGTVVAVGEGKKAEDGEQVKPNVAVGVTVMYSKYSGTEYEVRQRCSQSATSSLDL
jgi:chaperonin GroES